jgi:phosphatidylethanolamine/phosphatidyl-N-methylethanolamine N-methyltransferase
MVSKRHLQSVYTIWSKVYDSIVDKMFSFDRAKVINELNIKEGDKILELGVGTGLNLKHYSKGCTVYGIDFSLPMLEKAKQKKSKANVVLKMSDASNLKFEDNFFDKVLVTYVLRVAPNPFIIMFEASRVSKENARFVILDQFKGRKKLLLNLIEPIKLLLGWGKEYNLDELIKGTSWKLVKKEKFGKMSGTKLIVLINKKAIKP